MFCHDLFNKTSRLCISAICVVFVGLARSGHAEATIAFDDANQAAYSNGLQAEDNGGYGFAPWALSLTSTDNNRNGFFRYSSTINGDGRDDGSIGGLANDRDIDVGSYAWGLYANSGNQSRMLRYFLNDLAVGSTFSIDFDHGYVDYGGYVGLSLLNSAGAERLTFYYYGSYGYYFAVGNVLGYFPLSYGDEGMRLSFTPLDDGDSIQIVALRRDGLQASAIVALGGPAGSGVRGVNLFNFNAGPGSARDVFFNSMQILTVPEPTGFALALLVPFASFVLPRKRRPPALNSK